jgi:hypothetical protein
LNDGKNNSEKREAQRRRQAAVEQPTTDPRLVDWEKTPGSGMLPDIGGAAPSG